MYFHSLRVHLHICHWKYLNLHYLTTKGWEWRFVDNIMKPIKTDMQPSPESRLKLFAANVNQPQNMYVVKNYVYVGNIV